MAALFRKPYYAPGPLLLPSQHPISSSFQHLPHDSAFRQSPHHIQPSRWPSRVAYAVLHYIRRSILLAMIFSIFVWAIGSLPSRHSESTYAARKQVENGTGYTSDRVDENVLHLDGIKSAFVRATKKVVSSIPNFSRGDTSDLDRPTDVFGFPIIQSYPSLNETSYKPLRNVGVDDRTNQRSSASKHFYRSDGLLEVSPLGPHPIFELIQEAQKQWEGKQNRASKTLKEAYLEYQRRYGRRPPKGFEVWWTYVQSHSVPLPDEYDQIDRDLSPFWGVDPTYLRQTQRDREAHFDTYTVGKDRLKDPLAVLNQTSSGGEYLKRQGDYAAAMVIDLMEDVEEHLRPFRAVFNVHDGPNLHRDWELREEAKEAGTAGKYIDMTKSRESKRYGWISSCPPSSPAWANSNPYTQTPPSLPDLSLLKHKSSYARSPAGPAPFPSAEVHPKTFIHNHRLSMDPCLHPAHLSMHGQFLTHRAGPIPPRALIPQFSYSPSAMHDDIVIAVPYNWVDGANTGKDDLPFAEKIDSRLHWRGRNTGIWHGTEDDVTWSDQKRLGTLLLGEEEVVRPDGRLWWLSHRGRLVDWANKMWEEVVPRPAGGPEVNLSTNRVLHSTPNPLWAVGQPSAEVSKAKWAPGMADIAFVADPVGCDGKMCDRLKDIWEFRKMHDEKTEGKYRYIMDVDGNAWSSRFKRLITSHSLIFKATIYGEWWSDRIQPWVHYVPVQLDLSDLLDSLYFFRGDPSGNNPHTDLAEKIAMQGREWSLTHWRKEDLTAYMFRLFLEYARIMSEERDVKIDADIDADLHLVGGGHNLGVGGREVRMKVRKEDYVYRAEDEYVPEEYPGKQPWDWKYKRRATEARGP